MSKQIAMVIGLVVLLSACATATVGGYGQGGRQADGRSYEEARADNQLSAAVTRALVRDKTIKAMDIQVTARDGVVTLAGQVPQRNMSQHAEKLTASVPGVIRVVNRLQVGR